MFKCCATLFLAGEKRTIQRGSWIGFHQASWSKESIKQHFEENKEQYKWADAFDHSSWIHNDTQKEIFRDMKYLIERGVESIFPTKTMKADSEDMWYQRRKELEAAGTISEIDTLEAIDIDSVRQVARSVDFSTPTKD